MHHEDQPVYEHTDRMTDLDIEEAKMKAAAQRGLDLQITVHAGIASEDLPPVKLTVIRKGGSREQRSAAFYADRDG